MWNKKNTENIKNFWCAIENEKLKHTEYKKTTSHSTAINLMNQK